EGPFFRWRVRRPPSHFNHPDLRHAGWQQSPYVIPSLLGSTVYDRAGKSLGTLPWTIRQTVTWSADGLFLCAAVPERATTGAQMRLETAVPGQPATLIPSGVMTHAA